MDADCNSTDAWIVLYIWEVEIYQKMSFLHPFNLQLLPLSCAFGQRLSTRNRISSMANMSPESAVQFLKSHAPHSLGVTNHCSECSRVSVLKSSPLRDCGSQVEIPHARVHVSLNGIIIGHGCFGNTWHFERGLRNPTISHYVSFTRQDCVSVLLNKHEVLL